MNEEIQELNKRLSRIELLLAGDDKEPKQSNWSYEQLRTILDKSGLAPNMSRNQELCGLDKRVEDIEKIIDEASRTDAHIGEQTLPFRLSVIEGSLDIFAMSHLGHTNYQEAEFRGMHGYNPSETDEPLRKKVDGMQKKLDRIHKLLEHAEFTISGKEAMKL